VFLKFLNKKKKKKEFLEVFLPNKSIFCLA